MRDHGRDVVFFGRVKIVGKMRFTAACGGRERHVAAAVAFQPPQRNRRHSTDADFLIRPQARWLAHRIVVDKGAVGAAEVFDERVVEVDGERACWCERPSSSMEIAHSSSRPIVYSPGATCARHFHAVLSYDDFCLGICMAASAHREDCDLKMRESRRGSAFLIARAPVILSDRALIDERQPIKTFALQSIARILVAIAFPSASIICGCASRATRRSLRITGARAIRKADSASLTRAFQIAILAVRGASHANPQTEIIVRKDGVEWRAHVASGRNTRWARGGVRDFIERRRLSHQPRGSPSTSTRAHRRPRQRQRHLCQRQSGERANALWPNQKSASVL